MPQIKGILVKILPDIGYRATGVAIYKDILFVLSLRLIVSYNISDNLARLGNFVTFAFVPYECLPGGLVVWEDVLYVTCGAFVGSNVPTNSNILQHYDIYLSILKTR